MYTTIRILYRESQYGWLFYFLLSHGLLDTLRFKRMNSSLIISGKMSETTRKLFWNNFEVLEEVVQYNTKKQRPIPQKMIVKELPEGYILLSSYTEQEGFSFPTVYNYLRRKGEPYLLHKNRIYIDPQKITYKRSFPKKQPEEREEERRQIKEWQEKKKQERTSFLQTKKEEIREDVLQGLSQKQIRQKYALTVHDLRVIFQHDEQLYTLWKNNIFSQKPFSSSIKKEQTNNFYQLFSQNEKN